MSASAEASLSAHTAAAAAVRTAVAALLGDDVAPDTPLLQAGIDSLAAVELRNDLSRCVSILCNSVYGNGNTVCGEPSVFYVT